MTGAPAGATGPDIAPLRQLAAVCAETGPLLTGPEAAAVASVARRLAEPQLRLAVGGRLNAGKSTLVNALLGQCLAGTGATECTRLVTWFRHGPQNRVRVVLRDGSEHQVPGAPGGGVPREPAALGSAADDIAELVVEAPNDALRQGFRIVDTPGMDSLSGLDEAALAALGRADALLYVMPHPGEGDQEALEALRRQAGQAVPAAAVLGVLSRIDALGRGGGDPWPTARRLAGRYAGRLSGLVADVVPVAGLLAQAVCCERYTEADTEAVRLLAARPAAELGEALYSADSFLSWSAGPLTAAERERLLSLLGRWGIEEAVNAYDGEPTSALLERLRTRSGVAALHERLREEFLDRADRLRAATAFRALHAVARTLPATGPADALHSALHRVGRHPVLRQAALAPALTAWANGRLPLDEEHAAALSSLARGATAAACLGLDPAASPERIAARAAEEARRWRLLEFQPPRLVGDHARAARELCEALYFTLRGPGPDAALGAEPDAAVRPGPLRGRGRRR
ncbi:dynamin family protein [Streptomyces sp. NPDC006992]|uniref:dynamin family protein n=1 Tax=Streptomyces sp. NPDC006992 TaxID=3155601 RepID=UPI0033FC0E37